MTLLDDYQAKHKLEGVRVVSFMLHTIPKEILRRTGVDELIFTVRFPFISFYIIFWKWPHHSLLVSQNWPFPSVRPGDSHSPSINHLNVVSSHTQSRRTQVFWILRSSLYTCRQRYHRGDLDILGTESRGYESYIRWSTWCISSARYSYCQFSQGTIFRPPHHPPRIKKKWPLLCSVSYTPTSPHHGHAEQLASTTRKRERYHWLAKECWESFTRYNRGWNV